MLVHISALLRADGSTTTVIFTVEQLGKSDIWEEEGQYTVHMSYNRTSVSLHLDLHFYGFFFLFFFGVVGEGG